MTTAGLPIAINDIRITHEANELIKSTKALTNETSARPDAKQ